MRSFTSSSERLTAADRPGVAQPVPVRDIPKRPWRGIFLTVLVATIALAAFWEWKMRSLELLPGDLGDGASAWAEQRRRIDNEPVPVAIVGDSRILFDTNLDRFQALTGVRPVQLALPGTNARPFLEDLADDPHFKGLAIVGIAEGSYFRKEVGLQKDALERYKFESPAQRASFLIFRELARFFGFLDEDYRLSTLVLRLDPDWRRSVRGPYDDVWKLSTAKDERQTQMWPRLEHDAFLRAHARERWLKGAIFAGPPVKPDIIAMTLGRTRLAVAKIRAHGGEVVFVRPPSAPELRVLEDRRLPRPKGWDLLLKAANVKGIHADDLPDARELVMPEYSHLSPPCAVVFTDAYVRAIAGVSARIRLRQDAPLALRSSDCHLPARSDS